MIGLGSKGTMVSGAGGFHPRALCGLTMFVVSAPLLDDDLSLFEGVEDFAIEQLVAQTSVEALTIAGLPRRARFDISGC